MSKFLINFNVKNMKINVGTWDRALRMFVAFGAFAAGSLLVDGYARLALYVVSLVMVITSTTGFCLLYKVCSVDTSPNKKD